MNFDAPDVYHLYYGDEVGTPGTVMTYFPFQGMVKGRRGAGEVTETAFAIPKGTLPYWNERLAAHAVAGLEVQDRFGDHRLRFLGPDGDELVLAEVEEDVRQAFKEGPVPQDRGIHGSRSATLRLRDEGATAELLRFRGYEERERHGNLIRFGIKEGNGADLVDIEVQPDADVARQGAGSVHHIAFALR